MLYEGGYDIIELLPATKGMNLNTAPDLLKQEYSVYINNIMPDSLGEGKVRYGTTLFSDVAGTAPLDTVIKSFPFTSSDGNKQQILYYNGFQNFVTFTNIRITSPDSMLVESPNVGLFKPDTLLRVQYNYGTNIDATYQIKSVTPDVDNDNIVIIQFENNSFPGNLNDFYIDAIAPNPQRISNTQFSISISNDFIVDINYFEGQTLRLTINDGDPVDLIIAAGGIDTSINGQITFTVTTPTVPPFSNDSDRLLSYQSLTPAVSVLYNSYGYIKVLDMKTKTILAGGNQTISGLSVACVPRSEYFAKLLWIYNGVDPVMTWDGSILSIYQEQIKERAGSFNRINARNLSFVTDDSFNIEKYNNGQSIRLVVIHQDGTIDSLISVVSVVNYNAGTNIVTITVSDDLPGFTGQDASSVFYFDMPPKFSFMKGAHDRLWCLGEGAVSLEYRTPDLAMRFYYSYKPYSDEVDFKFFNEKTKSVPSEDISAKHGIADNLESIVQLSGNLIFMGRQNSQVWKGIDPLTPDANLFSWSSTLPIGIYHGDLIVELANDAQFLSQNGFASFGTLNIAKQFAASNTPNMDKMATEFMSSIDNNYQYRSCGSFKYSGGTFCGFKIGFNDIIVSKFHTSFFWWGLFSGDFTSAACFLSFQQESLYLYLENKVFQYADGFLGSPIMYGDQDETRYIDFSETKYANNISKRFANKRYEVECDYSSSIVINPENNVNIYISGNLRNTFVLEDLYKLPFRGDLLGTINLVKAADDWDQNLPNNTDLGMRLDSPSHTKKGRLKFVSNKFLVTISGKIKNGPFVLKKIRLFGLIER